MSQEFDQARFAEREADATFETTREPTMLPRAHRLCQYGQRCV